MLDFAPDPSLTVWGLATAGGLGLLIGVERERSKAAGTRREYAGIRTFALIGLAGGLSAAGGAITLLVTGLGVAAMAIASHRHTGPEPPDSTSEIAMLVTWLLGVTAMRSPTLAAAIGTTVVLLLAAKSPIHRFVTTQLTQQELHDGLLLIAIAFVVLPLLPSQTIDPWGAINPRRLGLLVVAMMTISSAGYFAMRLLGARLGLPLTGLAGGFVSSTATIAAMAGKAREIPELSPAYAGAALLSNVATIVQIGVVVGTLYPPLLISLALPLAAAGLVAALIAALQGWHALATMDGPTPPPGKRPFQPLHVLGFAAFLATTLLAAGLARRWLGENSLTWVSAATGIADVHAAVASVAQLVSSGQATPPAAIRAITAALAANSLLKCILSMTRGDRAFAIRLVPGIAAMVIAFTAAVMLAGLTSAASGESVSDVYPMVGESFPAPAASHSREPALY